MHFLLSWSIEIIEASKFKTKNWNLKDKNYSRCLHCTSELYIVVLQIKRSTVELYDGKVEPPSWKLILQASSTNETLADLNETVTLAETKLLLSKKKWTIPITRMAEKPTLTTPANWVRSPGQFNNYYRRCNYWNWELGWIYNLQVHRIENFSFIILLLLM